MNNIYQLLPKMKGLYILPYLFFILTSCQTSEITKAPPLPQVTEIAILMPMSGPNASSGKQYNELIKMGLNDGLKGHINVTSYDGADERQALASMEKIIKRNTKVILGPLYSPITSIIAHQAKQHGIIVISMSNNPVLAEEKLFVFGHAPLKQLDRGMSYFLENSYKNYIVLLPVGQHSRNVAKIIQDMTIRSNATLVRNEFYTDQPESIAKSVTIVSDMVDNLNEEEEVSTKTVIYIADDPKNLSLIFDSINKHNLDKKAIIVGDNRIDVDYPGNVNITFTGSLNIMNSNIIERAKGLGITHLTFMHAMAYDLGKMTANYIGEEFSPEGFLAKMNRSQPYVGLSGNIHFHDSIAQREYDIIRREDGVYNTLSNIQ